MRTPTAAWIGSIALCLCLAAAAARAEEAPAPIPVAEVTPRAAEVSAFLRSLNAELQRGGPIARIETDLPALNRRLTERVGHTTRTIESQPGLGSLDALAESWHVSQLGLRSWMELLTARAVWLDQQREHVFRLIETWSLTRTAVRAAKAPSVILDRVDTIRSSLAEAQEDVEAQRGAMLGLQDRVAREASRCEDALAQLAEARRRAAGELFVRETAPIWRHESRAVSDVPAALHASLDTFRAQLRRTIADQSERILGHAVFIVGLAGFFAWARRRAREWKATDAPAASLATLFDQPIAAALVVGFLLSFWIYSDPPNVVRTLFEIGVLCAAVVVLRRLLAPPTLPGLYTLAAFFLVDRVRDLASFLPLLERLLFLVEMLAAILLLGWSLWSGRARRVLAADGWRYARAREVLARLACVGFAVAFVAAAVGNMNLARLLGSGILDSGYLALALSAGRRLAQGVVDFTLRIWPLTALRMVERHRDLLARRAHTVLKTAAVIGWGLGTLDYFGLLRPAVASARGILAAELTRGALRLSIGDVLAFAITLYVAFLFSSLVRFVLEEDVFPRLRLRAGLPYALTSLLRYVIIFVGFIMALLALGVNLDRVTILGGAFGLGVGFGLQNIVNNFVSGLIVLFERPVRVGDAIQIGDVQGEVRRIGIRSSTVRNWEGAEVIVPNSLLVSDKVTNWTPAEPRRRLDIPVNVAYGTAPDKVLKVLAEVAHGHPDVAGQPAPQALFLGFGDSALRFVLQVWTDRLDRHVAIRSELGIAVYAALREAGMTIPFPQQEIRVVGGGESPLRPPERNP
jgi:potassium efflux system protein